MRKPHRSSIWTIGLMMLIALAANSYADTILYHSTMDGAYDTNEYDDNGAGGITQSGGILVLDSTAATQIFWREHALSQFNNTNMLAVYNMTTGSIDLTGNSYCSIYSKIEGANGNSWSFGYDGDVTDINGDVDGYVFPLVNEFEIIKFLWDEDANIFIVGNETYNASASPVVQYDNVTLWTRCLGGANMSISEITICNDTDRNFQCDFPAPYPNISNPNPANGSIVDYGCLNMSFELPDIDIDGEYNCTYTNFIGDTNPFNSTNGTNANIFMEAVYTGNTYTWAVSCDNAGSITLENYTFSVSNTCVPIVFSNEIPANGSSVDKGCRNLSTINYSININTPGRNCTFTSAFGNPFDSFLSSAGYNYLGADVNLPNGSAYNWSISCTDALGGGNNETNQFVLSNTCGPVVISDVFTSDQICFLNNSIAYVFGICFIITLLIAMFVINEIFWRVPFIHCALGFAVIIATLPFYACGTWIGITMTLVGMIMFMYGIIVFAGWDGLMHR